ncbi:hypothetical protein AB0I51_41375 [Streptomyces sp. NPDC050549]|uniref:hypothetical protein n=1 Tax=Streptomyces sp. NPDC050549 TaxID=3155406 RepID=UPI003418833B
MFGADPTTTPQWQPDTGLGWSWGLYGVVYHVAAFRFLPVAMRLRLVKRVLGPFGSWWLKPRLEGVVSVHVGQHIIGAARNGDWVTLTTRDADGRIHAVETGYVLAATGYRVRLDAVDFLAPELTRKAGFPHLDAGLQSSVPGLYFTGIQAAATFGHCCDPRAARSSRHRDSPHPWRPGVDGGGAWGDVAAAGRPGPSARPPAVPRMRAGRGLRGSRRPRSGLSS